MNADRSVIRDVATLGAGLAVGMIASRVLAPMLASASGSVKSRLGEDPFQLLIDDHREVLDTLQTMEVLPEDATARRMKAFLMVKRSLAKHAMAEEDIVYPLLYEEVNAVDEARQLFNEHAEMKVHLFTLERALKQGGDWRNKVSSLRRLIEQHARQEEDAEFPKLREKLSKKQTRKLPAYIRREEAMVL